MGDDEQAESERSAARAEAQAHGILKNADAWAAKMKAAWDADLAAARANGIPQSRTWPQGEITIHVTARHWSPEMEAEFGPTVGAAMIGSRPAILTTAADVLNLVERHGRFVLSDQGGEAGEVTLTFENDYD